MGKYYTANLLESFIQAHTGFKNEIIIKLIDTDLLPNENDEFHDGSADEYSQPDPPRIPAIAPLRRTIRISKSHKNKQKKSLRQSKKPVIQIESDGDEGYGQLENEVHKFENTIHLIDLDDQQIEYYKSKLNILPFKEQETKTANINEDEQSKLSQEKFVPPVDIEKVPKFIYQYPPYPLGPTDTWPPKYPNSWRTFKKQMKECRKLQ